MSQDQPHTDALLKAAGIELWPNGALASGALNLRPNLEKLIDLVRADSGSLAKPIGWVNPKALQQLGNPDQIGNNWCPIWSVKSTANTEPLYSVAGLAQETKIKISELEAKAKLAEELLSALGLCFDHCRLYHPEVEYNNVGEVVRNAFKSAVINGLQLPVTPTMPTGDPTLKFQIRVNNFEIDSTEETCVSELHKTAKGMRIGLINVYKLAIWNHVNSYSTWDSAAESQFKSAFDHFLRPYAEKRTIGSFSVQVGPAVPPKEFCPVHLTIQAPNSDDALSEVTITLKLSQDENIGEPQ